MNGKKRRKKGEKKKKEKKRRGKREIRKTSRKKRIFSFFYLESAGRRMSHIMVNELSLEGK